MSSRSHQNSTKEWVRVQVVVKSSPTSAPTHHSDSSAPINNNNFNSTSPSNFTGTSSENYSHECTRFFHLPTNHHNHNHSSPPPRLQHSSLSRSPSQYPHVRLITGIHDHNNPDNHPSSLLTPTKASNLSQQSSPPSPSPSSLGTQISTPTLVPRIGLDLSQQPADAPPLFRPKLLDPLLPSPLFSDPSPPPPKILNYPRPASEAARARSRVQPLPNYKDRNIRKKHNGFEEKKGRYEIFPIFPATSRASSTHTHKITQNHKNHKNSSPPQKKKIFKNKIKKSLPRWGSPISHVKTSSEMETEIDSRAKEDTEEAQEREQGDTEGVDRMDSLLGRGRYLDVKVPDGRIARVLVSLFLSFYFCFCLFLFLLLS